MSIIEAASIGVRTMADGTLRLTVDIEPRNAQAAFALFGAPGTAMALAALKPGAPAAAEPPKAGARPAAEPIGPICKWLAMRCKEDEFRAWLGVTGGFSTLLDEGAAADVVRVWCGVDSRKDIDGDERAEAKFQRNIRGPWLKHQLARGATNKPTKEHA